MSGTWGSDDTLIVRLYLWLWFSEEALSQDRIIDLSTLKAQREFFKKGPDGYGAWVDQNFHELPKALTAKEVLIKWRGQIPLKYSAVTKPRKWRSRRWKRSC